MSSEDPIVIVGMARTPMGGLLGELAGMSANELGAEAVKAALAEAGVAGDDVDLIYMGNVLSAGQGQAPARQAAIKGGLPKSVEATTLNKMCGSGMQAAIMGRASIASGDASVIVAGGMESMTNAPHLMPNHRTGFKYGHDVIKDHMAQDGLEDAYEGNAMGVFADMIAREHQFTREDQDAYALETLARAIRATEKGDFKREITPVTIKSRKGDVTVETDELPRKARPEKIPSLKPAFGKDGTVTAANASAISDGAAALVMMRQSEAERRGLKPLAKIVATAAHAHEPAYFTTAPVPAMRKVLEKAGWTKDDVDLWEINEAFAVVPMIAMKELGLSHDVVNVNGGACALGHPIGASGARIMVTLIAALESQGKTKGVASLCIGGGEATAVAIERLN
ncbi:MULTISPECIES: thiolase family protein [Oceanicaulis]|jgi:acetyl-CoA C-acetyltransferase|uniref:thiolase family protein n=1 Tax=Oceanicaulis TaxID=153232 RepID=UPI0003B484D8|nr:MULTISPECIES: thiolase family protein [Oceanicaulis]MBL4539673.1 thiolase family protein [Oceanicaulis sp.]VXC78312.1 Acetyl-CoA acetyltransferase [Oceanicaulis sp. 350]|tara:strand:+ start:8461 stop:9648 length:1188 start_codon:yes stop_codon:yes gene_type:complete